ncbi:superoxide dismutase [Rodentibacter mrazii]|uniref:Superoxide dismutase n=1 Tax=Rodentibacter mrazii TaxID=1908257 RepID=A0A1V3I7Y4_9PAST|nr:superoxide dismutase [Rodentibacter mrazii]OOF36096.1 superoxide dismutase [Rodentibacter mrazii]
MRILVLDVPCENVALTDYAPHLLNEIKHGWALIKSDFIREIYMRQDRPGVAFFVEAESVEKAKEVCAEFPLVKAGLVDFDYIPLGNYLFVEQLFAEEHKG